MKCKCPFRSDTSDWRERFEKQHRYRGCNEADYQAIKAFIEKELEQVRGKAYMEGFDDNDRENIKRIERAREEGRNHACAKHCAIDFEAGRADERSRVRELIAGMKIVKGSLDYRGGYNTALTDLLDTLKG